MCFLELGELRNGSASDKKLFGKFPETELKDLNDQADDCGYLWRQFGEAWNFVTMKDDTSFVHPEKMEDL